jgi:hypothetical protein
MARMPNATTAVISPAASSGSRNSRFSPIAAPGVGKLTLLRAVHQRRDPSGRFGVLDAAEATSQDWLVRARHALLEGDGDLVIRHIDRLNSRQAHFLASVLQEMRAAGQPETRRVVATRTSGSEAPANLAELLRSFPRTVALPPLRHHVEDLPDLVQFFIGKLSQHSRLTCSPDAMQLPRRSACPGRRSIARSTATASSSPPADFVPPIGLHPEAETPAYVRTAGMGQISFPADAGPRAGNLP